RDIYTLSLHDALPIFQPRPHVFEIQVVADVPVKVPVIVVAGIAFCGAPHLFGRFDVAPEGGHARIGAVHGRIHRIARPGTGVQQTVGFADEPADACTGQPYVVGRAVAALGQPKALGRPAEDAPVGFDAHVDLGPHRPLVGRHQGQVAVGGRGGDDLQVTAVLEAAKGRRQVA